jgi:hypothetical protein
VWRSEPGNYGAERWAWGVEQGVVLGVVQDGEQDVEQDVVLGVVLGCQNRGSGYGLPDVDWASGRG